MNHTSISEPLGFKKPVDLDGVFLTHVEVFGIVCTCGFEFAGTKNQIKFFQTHPSTHTKENN